MDEAKLFSLHPPHLHTKTKGRKGLNIYQVLVNTSRLTRIRCMSELQMDEIREEPKNYFHFKFAAAHLQNKCLQNDRPWIRCIHFSWVPFKHLSTGRMPQCRGRLSIEPVHH
uniref:Uncharacterized protein n=1 Tax=Populus davidiana TaxID=266767 RepID=A0A6M2E946_9ROSI